jgi:site-specific DNA-cytosine methylase
MVLLSAGCGSSNSYVDHTRTAVDRVASAIRTYDQAHPHNLSSTGAACGRALSGLQGQRVQIVATSPPSQYRSVASALSHAYLSASRGFSDCRKAAAALSYRLMARADRELAQANSWIQRARTLDGA